MARDVMREALAAGVAADRHLQPPWPSTPGGSAGVSVGSPTLSAGGSPGGDVTTDLPSNAASAGYVGYGGQSPMVPNPGPLAMMESSGVSYQSDASVTSWTFAMNTDHTESAAD